MQPDPYYSRHVFFCLNQRAEGRECCAAQGAEALQQYAKQRVQALGLSGRGSIRINKAGCLDRCELGPVFVVYPEGVWYTAVDEDDVEEIIQSHLIKGRVVERLVLREAA
ncbi:MAG: (2Fe-2S) ferredoxin domain-containing protein [Betaproteobacteria bacterium]|nr:(2Fe-2S) ferredoxin domain-containing protein [Betaproteobacteria bacterium]